METGNLMERDGVWTPLTPGKPVLTSEQGSRKENVNEEFSCTDGFNSMRYMEKCVLNKKCELPAGILEELEAGLDAAGTEPKGTTSVQDDTGCVLDDTVKVSSSEHESKKARVVDESRDGIGSIPTPSKTKETKKRRNDGNDINKKPSQRPRVKKHRPKIYDDSKPKKVPKAQTSRATPRPKTPKPSTPNRVQERRTQSRNSTNCTQKSTSFGVEHVGQAVQEASRAITVRSCKRFLDFDHHAAVKESKSHEQPLTLCFDFEKFDCFRGKIVTSKRNTTRRSKFQNKSLKASDTLVIDNNKVQQEQDICVTRNQEQVDKYGRKYAHFYQRRKKISSNLTSPVSITPTLLVYRRSFRGNQCLYNSRKCGPVFPKLFKKHRTMRKKVTIKVNPWYVRADELRKNLVKRSRKLTQNKNVQDRVNKSKGKKAVVKSHFFTDEFLSLFSQTRRKRSIMRTRFNENIANFPYDLENDLVMHTRFNENVANIPYDLENDLLCQEENFLGITEYLPLYDVPVQRIKSFTSPHQDFPRFDNYFGNMNWFQLQEVAVYGSQNLSPQHILHTRKDLNEFNASEVEHLIWKMASLDIKDQCKDLVVRDQNVSGALVKIPPKKRKNIPKVDLDTETLRVWKLLMENDGSEPVVETDKDKEEWWETQRNIFRGRVDSFIAKMHLIQGNRRFSPWKGSVTDSVVGVYLTQNVSDHLSSSAFMSVAARFPAYYRSKEVDDEFEVPNSQESVASNAQICEGCAKINETEHVVSASYADGSDVTPTVEPNQNPLQAQDKNNETEQDTSASYADASDATPAVEPNQDSLQVQDKNIEMEQDMNASYADVSEATPTVETNQNPLLALDNNNETEHDVSASYADVCDMTPMVEPNQNPLQAQDKNNETEQDTSASYADVCDVTPMMEPNQSPLQAQDKNTEMEQDMSALYADISDATPTVEPNQNQLQVQDKPCANEDSNTFRKFLEAEEANYLKQFWGVDIDESVSSISENKPSAITFDLNVSLSETSEGEFVGQQKSTPVEGPKVTTPICSPQSEVTTEQGVVSANSHKYTETPLENEPKGKKKNKKEKKQIPKRNWDEIRKTHCKNGEKETNVNYRDIVDWEAVRCAPAKEIAKIIEDRGMHNVIAGRIKEFLDRMYEDHDTLDLEWLRDVPPDTAKEFLLSIEGLGLKSVECVRLLTLHHNAFPVDTNVGRVATRLGWVPLQPLPDSVQIHLLNAYPMVDNIQKYLYPRLCTLDQKTLYELHYQLITFGKVFCTKIKPNCNACPMRAECRHYASAFASGRLALPGTKESSNVTSIVPAGNEQNHSMGQPPSSIDLKINNSGSSYQDQSQTNEPIIELNEQNHSMGQPPSFIDLKIKNSGSSYQDQSQTCEPIIEVPPSSFDLEVNNTGPSYQDQSQTCEPIIEVPPSPEPEVQSIIGDIEDLWCESDDDEIPTIRLNTEEFRETLKETMDTNKTPIPDADVSKAVIAFSAEAENIRVPPKKFIAKSRTMHLVYELPDFHPCLAGFEDRDPNDPTPYLLAVWFPGEVTNSLEYTENRACAAANNNLEETIKATVLIPCRTANRGSFPLNGTYFQVNEVFADDETSHVPMDVPRRQLCNLPLRELGCGSSATSIFKALSTGAIQRLFWRGSICVRGFNRKTRQPKQLNRKFHISTSVVAAENRKSKRENKPQ